MTKNHKYLLLLLVSGFLAIRVTYLLKSFWNIQNGCFIVVLIGILYNAIIDAVKRNKPEFAKYLHEIVTAIFIFIFLLLTLYVNLTIALPNKWKVTYINLGLLPVNIPSILSVIIAAIVAIYYFKIPIHAKTRNLSIKNSLENNIDENEKII